MLKHVDPQVIHLDPLEAMSVNKVMPDNDLSGQMMAFMSMIDSITQGVKATTVTPPTVS